MPRLLAIAAITYGLLFTAASCAQDDDLLAFDPPPTFNDPEEDEDAAREMREAEARETETTEGAAVGKRETGTSGDVEVEKGTQLADPDVGDAEKDSDGTLGGSVKKRKRELPGDTAGQNDE